jgi:hypothetical protein
MIPKNTKQKFFSSFFIVILLLSSTPICGMEREEDVSLEQKSAFLALPDKLIYLIFFETFTDYNGSNYCRCKQVCKELNHILSDEKFKKYLCIILKNIMDDHRQNVRNKRTNSSGENQKKTAHSNDEEKDDFYYLHYSCSWGLKLYFHLYNTAHFYTIQYWDDLLTNRRITADKKNYNADAIFYFLNEKKQKLPDIEQKQKLDVRGKTTYVSINDLVKRSNNLQIQALFSEKYPK